MSQYCDNFFDMWETADGFNMYEANDDEFQSWNGLRGPQGPKGDTGTGLEIAGITESVSGLPPTGSSTKVWLVGAAAPYDGYIYQGGAWVNIGQVGAGLVGPAGPAGPPGQTGPAGPPEIPQTTISYKAGASPTTPPSGTWSSSPVSVLQGYYLWTRVELEYSDGNQAVYYSVARQGEDGQLNIYLKNVPCSATTGNFAIVSDNRITADHAVAEIYFAAQAYIVSNVTWTTAEGSLTLNGTCTVATTANILLVKTSN